MGVSPGIIIMVQEGPAARLSAAGQTVSNREQGFSAPSPEMLVKLAEVMNVEINVSLDKFVETNPETIPARYDVIIIGAGPGGIFAAYELVRHRADLRIAVFESGHALD